MHYLKKKNSSSLAFQDALPAKEKQPLGTKNEALAFHDALLEKELHAHKKALAFQNALFKKQPLKERSKKENKSF